MDSEQDKEMVNSEVMIKCSFSKWYKLLHHITIKSKIIPLGEEVIEYLSSDGIVLPDDLQPARTEPGRCIDADKADSDTVDWDEEELEENDGLSSPHLPEQFMRDVESSVKELGGSVFVKLNWSSAKDASWITCGNSLRCDGLSDILLLLKSSTFITHDLDYCERSGIQPELVLRQWQEGGINPATEFRCFVNDHKIIGISQRDCRTHYPHMELDRDSLLTHICQFYDTHIQGTFPTSTYVFDIFGEHRPSSDTRQEQQQIRLLDFSPLSPDETDPLLFAWDELLNVSGSLCGAASPTFRCVGAQSPSAGLPVAEYRRYAYPLEVAAVGAHGGVFAQFANLKVSDFQNMPETASADKPD